KRILIAEDVELNQFIARQILESWGMDVAVAANGRIALEMVQEQHFDLILMDIQMPEMDGIEATELIRKLGDTRLANIPIIALTANALKGDNHLYFQAGMNDYITKPYTEEKLYSVLSKFLPANPLSVAPVVEMAKPSTRILVEEGISLSNNYVEEGLLYDLTMVRQIGKGNPDFIGKMVTLFLEQLPSDISKLKEYSQKDEWESLSKLAHRMKPSIEGMGIHSLKTIIRELETRSRNNESIHSSELKKMVAFTCETMEKVLVQLRLEFPK
ncbi:MAG TPA: response regulator, partial [Sediminibacterium sp.]|nr:response regulator [Sediminibacterium sp.]